MQLKAIHCGWLLGNITIQIKPSGGNCDKRSPEDADVKPPRAVLLLLGGFVFEARLGLAKEGVRHISSSLEL